MSDTLLEKQEQTEVLKSTQEYMRIDEINAEVNSIFEISQEVSIEHRRAINAIKKEIDKIYIKDSVDKIEHIYSQIDDIYKHNNLTESDEQSLSDLEKEINVLFMNNSSADITSEDDKLLTDLNIAIEKLYEPRELSLTDLKRVETLLSEKETLSAALFK